MVSRCPRKPCTAKSRDAGPVNLIGSLSANGLVCGLLRDLHIDLKQLRASIVGAGRQRAQLAGAVENELANAEAVLFGPPFDSVYYDKGFAGTLGKISDAPTVGTKSRREDEIVT